MANVIEFVIRLKDQFSGSFRKINKGLDDTSTKANKAEKSVGGLGQALGALALTAGFIKLSTDILKAGSALETLNIEFEVLIGNASMAQSLIDDLNRTAATTPFQQKDIFDAGRILLTYGIIAEDVEKTIRIIGDTAQGSAEKLKNIIFNFAQIKSVGKASAIDIRQFALAGFNVLGELEKMTGISQKELQKLVSKGAIGFDEIEAAFISATSEGGKFHNMMARVSQSGMGLWSTFTGNFQQSMAEMGIEFVEAFKPMIRGLISMTKWMNENKKILVPFVAIIGGFVGALALATTALSIYAIAAATAGAASFWIIGIVGVIGALSAAFIFFYSTSSKFRAFFGGLGSIIKQMGKNIEIFLTQPFTHLMNIVKPFFQALDAFQKGQWGKAAGHIAQGFSNVLTLGLTNDSDEAFTKGYDDSLKKDREAKAKADKLNKANERKDVKKEIDQDIRAKLLSALGDKDGASKTKSGGTSGVNISGKGGNRQLTITKLQIAETVIVRTEEDLKMLEKNMMTLLTGALNDANQQA